MLKALQFHRITSDFQFGGTWNRPEQFRGFVKSLADGPVRAVLPGEADDGIVLTFDDGEENVYRHAFPVLEEFGVKAVVFLVAGYIGLPNRWDPIPAGRRPVHLNWFQILAMRKKGIEFGSHGMTHRNLTRLDDVSLDYELSESRNILQKELGAIRSISYPFNRTSERVINRTRAAGYRFGFGGEGEHDLRLKKEAIYITDTLTSFRIKIREAPAAAYRYFRRQQKAINLFTIASMLLQDRLRSSLHSGTRCAGGGF